MQIWQMWHAKSHSHSVRLNTSWSNAAAPCAIWPKDLAAVQLQKMGQRSSKYWFFLEHFYCRQQGQCLHWHVSLLYTHGSSCDMSRLHVRSVLCKLSEGKASLTCCLTNDHMQFSSEYAWIHHLCWGCYLFTYYMSPFQHCCRLAVSEAGSWMHVKPYVFQCYVSVSDDMPKILHER